jgi:hypothetical protein
MRSCVRQREGEPRERASEFMIDAAKVLGSLAEAYLAIGQKSKAVTILHSYYNEKYNRFSAFRKEVNAVVKDSDLLRNSGLLNQQL